MLSPTQSTQTLYIKKSVHSTQGQQFYCCREIDPHAEVKSTVYECTPAWWLDATSLPMLAFNLDKISSMCSFSSGCHRKISLRLKRSSMTFIKLHNEYNCVWTFSCCSTRWWLQQPEVNARLWKHSIISEGMVSQCRRFRMLSWDYQDWDYCVFFQGIIAFWEKTSLRLSTFDHYLTQSLVSGSRLHFLPLIPYDENAKRGETASIKTHISGHYIADPRTFRGLLIWIIVFVYFYFYSMICESLYAKIHLSSLVSFLSQPTEEIFGLYHNMF